MKKISTFYKKDIYDLALVVNEVNPENEWVFKFGIPTRKYDGSAMVIIKGELYKRYDAKKGKLAPLGAIPCQEPDLITGHHPHWVKCNRIISEDKYAFEAFDKKDNWQDGTYELCGEKVHGNPEKIKGHELILHGMNILDVADFSFEGLRKYLSDPLNDIEGIVFYDKTNKERMCKIKKSNFGIKR
jgi:hypothetical protein